MKTKMTVQIDGMNFEIPSECLQKDYDGNDIIRLGSKHAASIVKQYVTRMYPGLNVQATSDRYAGGESARVYICNPDGSSVDKEVYNTISDFAEQFTAGRFNGMEDIYEYKRDGVTDNGITIVNYTSYVFIENRPKWDSPLGILQSLKAMMAGDYDFGVVNLETAIQKVKRYGHKDSQINKALQLM